MEATWYVEFEAKTKIVKPKVSGGRLGKKLTAESTLAPVGHVTAQFQGISCIYTIVQADFYCNFCST